MAKDDSKTKGAPEDDPDARAPTKAAADAPEKSESADDAEEKSPKKAEKSSKKAKEEDDSRTATTEKRKREDAIRIEPTPPVPGGPSKWGPHLPLIIAAIVPILFFFFVPPLSKSGLWDPYELNVADLARRIAVNLHGATSLVLEGGDNTLPHLNDLGRPQLPFTSIAIGFKLFGLTEWGGRAPLALWGVLGVLATYAWVSRLVDKRAGMFSAIALTTMPLYFVQARTMLGEITTMAAMTMAFGGLAVTVFDRADDGSRRGRLLFTLMAIAGLFAGFESRGGLIGIGVPCLGVGLAWLIALGSGRRRGDLQGDVVGALSVAVGVFAVVKAALVLNLDPKEVKDLNMWVGAMIHTPGKYPTFDDYVGHIGHALVPWSGFAPFALGRLFIAPPGRTGGAFERESDARSAILVGGAMALVAHGVLAAHVDFIAWSGPALIAAACGIALRDYERGAHPSIAVGVGTGVFLGLFHHDFHSLPEKAYQAYAIQSATFPESFKDTALLLWTVALVGFAGLAFLTWVERDSDRKPFDPEGYRKVMVTLRDAWDGILALMYFAMVAGASLAGLAIWVGIRTHAKWLPNMSLGMRESIVNAWWMTAFIPLLVVFGTYFWCDVWLWAFGRYGAVRSSSFTRGFEPFEDLYAKIRETKGETRWCAALILGPLMYLQVPGVVFYGLWSHGTRWLIAAALAIPSGILVMLALGFLGDLFRGSRPAALVFFATVLSGVLCFSYFPALANQVSPKEVFETYKTVHKDGEPLGMLGVGGRTAAYYAGGSPVTLHDTNSALAWMLGGQGQRRFVVINASELPRLNYDYRKKIEPRANLPVIDARSSQILLVASKLAPGEKSESPIDKIVLPEPPHPQHKLEVNMDDKLEVVGYDVIDAVTNKLVDSVSTSKKYKVRTYYHVIAPITTEWESFIHIDGFHRRHNGDHKITDGKYPMSLWLEGDYIADDYELQLEPNFSPGPYTMYFGLFVGETRMKVKSGPNDGDNRIIGGTIHVQ